MLAANSSILWSRPEEIPGPEQIDGWLRERVPGGRVYPRTGLGAAYCLWGRACGVRPEVLVAQGAQECFFYREYENTHWIEHNNPAGMVYYAGRFEEGDAPAGANRAGYFARFATKRHGIKAHCRLVRDYAARGYYTVERFLSAWGTGQVAKVIAWANEIRAQPRLDPPGIRDEYTQHALTQLFARGIVTGYPDGYLRDEWPLTRAQAAALLMRAFGYVLWHKKREVATPPDARGHWAEKEIVRVMQAGWMAGYPDGSFRPDNLITRAEVCAVLFNIGSLPQFVYRGPQAFPDVTAEKIPKSECLRRGDKWDEGTKECYKWYYPAVMWAYQNGWLGEFVGGFGERRFCPEFPVSRGETAHLLWQMVKALYPPATGRLPATAGAPRREKLVPAVWIGAEKRWAPAWAAPVFVSEAEAFERPVTAVPAAWVASPAATVGRKPLVILGAAAAGIAAGTGIYFLLKE